MVWRLLVRTLACPRPGPAPALPPFLSNLFDIEENTVFASYFINWHHCRTWCLSPSQVSSSPRH